MNHVKKARSAAVIGLALAQVFGLSGAALVAAPPKEISLNPIGTYRDGAFEVSAAEIVAHDPVTQRLFGVNVDPEGPAIDDVVISNPISRVAFL